jgi:hypothetical protein
MLRLYQSAKRGAQAFGFYAGDVGFAEVSGYYRFHFFIRPFMVKIQKNSQNACIALEFNKILLYTLPTRPMHAKSASTPALGS